MRQLAGQVVIGGLVGVAFMVVATRAIAQDAVEADAQTQMSRLISLGQIEAARAVLDSQSPDRAERLFFDARVLKAQNRLPEAIATFRQVLLADPDHLNARRELAHSLLLDRQFAASRHQFRTLMDIDGNTAMKDGYRRFLDTIDRERPFGLSGWVALLPSTNINRGTTETTFDVALGRFIISSESRATSGTGVELGMAGFARHAIGGGARVSLDWSLAGRRYRETAFDSTSGTLGLSLGRADAGGAWVAGVTLRKTARADDSGHRAVGLRFGAYHNVTPDMRIGLVALHESRSFPERAYQDGTFDQVHLNWDKWLRPSLAIHASVALERETPQARHLRYDGGFLSFGATRSFEGGLSARIESRFGLRDFVGDYPLMTDPRRDRYSAVSISVQHNRFEVRGFAPRLSCTHTRNRSNISFNDYVATECAAALSRSF